MIVTSDANQQGASPAGGYQLSRIVCALADKSKGSFLELAREGRDGERERRREREEREREEEGEGGREVFEAIW